MRARVCVCVLERERGNKFEEEEGFLLHMSFQTKAVQPL